MKRFLPLSLLAVLALTVAPLALANPSVTFRTESPGLKLPACPAGDGGPGSWSGDGGGGPQTNLSGTLARGHYLLRVTDATSHLCFGQLHCATGGETFPAGTVLVLRVPPAGVSFACRSAASAGSVYLTRVDVPGVP